jgi:hypothetical protein
MMVGELITALQALPSDALVMHLWDGGTYTEINHVWLARNGSVVTADDEMVCYRTDDRPTDAPTAEIEPFWFTGIRSSGPSGI